MANLNAEVRYFPYEMPRMWACTNFCYDEVKQNLLWLVCPEVDTLIHTFWQGNEVTRSIDAYMSGPLRVGLSGPPVEFMRDFSTLTVSSDLEMVQNWPADYLRTMWGRAKEANARLCAGLGPNVFMVDFKNRRRYG